MSIRSPSNYDELLDEVGKVNISFHRSLSTLSSISTLNPLQVAITNIKSLRLHKYTTISLIAMTVFGIGMSLTNQSALIIRLSVPLGKYKGQATQ